MTIDAAKKARLKKAFENPDFTWRTIQGVAKETGIDVSEVKSFVEAPECNILRSRVPNQDGAPLYTTREHYRAKAGAGEKIRRAFRNRGA